MYHFCFHVHCRYIKNTKLAAICNTATSIWSLHTPAQHVKHALVHSWVNNVYTTHGNAFSLKGIKLTCTYLTYFKIRLKGTTLPHADCLLTSVCITTCACSRGHLSHDFTRSQCRKDVRACSRTASILPNISGRWELYYVLQLRQGNKLSTLATANGIVTHNICYMSPYNVHGYAAKSWL